MPGGYRLSTYFSIWRLLQASCPPKRQQASLCSGCRRELLLRQGPVISAARPRGVGSCSTTLRAHLLPAWLLSRGQGDRTPRRATRRPRRQSHDQWCPPAGSRRSPSPPPAATLGRARPGAASSRPTHGGAGHKASRRAAGTRRGPARAVGDDSSANRVPQPAPGGCAGRIAALRHRCSSTLRLCQHACTGRVGRAGWRGAQGCRRGGPPAKHVPRRNEDENHLLRFIHFVQPSHRGGMNTDAAALLLAERVAELGSES